MTKQDQKKLNKLEIELDKLYSEGFAEDEEAIAVYLDSFYKEYKQKEKEVEAGKITRTTLEAWAILSIKNDTKWGIIRNKSAKKLTKLNKKAAGIINNAMPSIFANNANAVAVQLSEALGVSFDLLNENMLDHLHVEFKTVNLNPKRDYEWNKKKIEEALEAGIRQGKSVDDLSDDFLEVMKRNKTAALRNARTATNSTANAGTMETMLRAEEKGFNTEKEWIATADARTRDSHAQLNGVRVGTKEKFPNGLMFPLDPEGAPAEVYNCRCSMRYILGGINDKQRTDNTAKTYIKWVEEQRKK